MEIDLQLGDARGGAAESDGQPAVSTGAALLSAEYQARLRAAGARMSTGLVDSPRWSGIDPHRFRADDSGDTFCAACQLPKRNEIHAFGWS